MQRLTVLAWWNGPAIDAVQSQMELEHALTMSWLASIPPMRFRNRNNPDGQDSICYVLDLGEGEQAGDAILGRIVTFRRRWPDVSVQASIGEVIDLS